MITEILGLPLESAVSRLRAAGIEPIDITEINAPRGETPRGNLRVVRVQNGGKKLTCARFPDTLKEEEIENS